LGPQTGTGTPAFALVEVTVIACLCQRDPGILSSSQSLLEVKITQSQLETLLFLVRRGSESESFAFNGGASRRKERKRKEKARHDKIRQDK